MAGSYAISCSAPAHSNHTDAYLAAVLQSVHEIGKTKSDNDTVLPRNRPVTQQEDPRGWRHLARNPEMMMMKMMMMFRIPCGRPELGGLSCDMRNHPVHRIVDRLMDDIVPGR